MPGHAGYIRLALLEVNPFGIRDSGLGARDSGFGIRGQGLGFGDSEFALRDSASPASCGPPTCHLRPATNPCNVACTFSISVSLAVKIGDDRGIESLKVVEVV